MCLFKFSISVREFLNQAVFDFVNKTEKIVHNYLIYINLTHRNTIPETIMFFQLVHLGTELQRHPWCKSSFHTTFDQ